MDLKAVLKNNSYRKILRFFHENPSSIDTGRGVATWTNQEIKMVRAALKRLASLGLLVAHKVSSTTGYSYTRDKDKAARVGRLLREYE
jgi:predicted transcriptional regulator